MLHYFKQRSAVLSLCCINILQSIVFQIHNSYIFERLKINHSAHVIVTSFALKIKNRDTLACSAKNLFPTYSSPKSISGNIRNVNSIS